MKKCKCGREIDDRWEECFLCAKKNKTEEPKDRQSSIERQVAAKCVAAVFEGRTATESEIVAGFNLFLRLIRG
jgi:hypothetical protein